MPIPRRRRIEPADMSSVIRDRGTCVNDMETLSVSRKELSCVKFSDVICMSRLIKFLLMTGIPANCIGELTAAAKALDAKAIASNNGRKARCSLISNASMLIFLVVGRTICT